MCNCPLFPKCGGCSLLDVPYEKQVEDKNAILASEIGKLNPNAVIEPPVTGPALHYRSRARFRYSKDGLSFYEEHSNTPVLIRDCPVLDEKLNAVLKNPPHINLWELKDGELSCFSADKKVIFNDEISWVTVNGRKLPVSGSVFFQSNLILLPKMIDYVCSKVEGRSVMDLYAGIGTFSAFLEDNYNVTAVEINKKCLSLAKQHLTKTRFFTSPVEKWNPRVTTDTVIVDPPRVGLDVKVPAMIASWRPKLIIYVSCNRSTLIRDLYRFKDRGYTTTSARLFDFYPNTPHVETVVLMSRGE